MKRKLFVLIIFAINILVFMAISVLNCSSCTQDAIIADKTIIIAEKNGDMSDAKFVNYLKSVSNQLNADVMIESHIINEDFSEVIYYKTNISSDFIDLKCENNSTLVFDDDVLSEIEKKNVRKIYNLNISDVYVSIKNIDKASECDLSKVKLVIANDIYESFVSKLTEYGIACAEEINRYAGVDNTTFYFILFTSVFFLSLSVVYYSCWQQKNYTVRKTFGFSNANIVIIEVKKMLKEMIIIAVSLYVIVGILLGLVFDIHSSALFIKKSILNFICFFIIIMLIFAFSVSINSALCGVNQIKGKHNYKLLNTLTCFIKLIVMIIIIFEFSITCTEWKNVTCGYKLINNSKDKIENLYKTTISVRYENPDLNRSDYRERFYKLYKYLYDNYDCILASGSGKGLHDDRYKGSITVNDRFVDVCEIYDIHGEKISRSDISRDKLTIILPGENFKENYETEYNMIRDRTCAFYQIDEKNIEYLIYDPEISQMFSFEIDGVDADNYGYFSDVVIIVWNVDLDPHPEIMLTSWLTQNIMFQVNSGNNVYDEIYPFLKENNLDKIILRTPSVKQEFNEYLENTKKEIILLSSLIILYLFLLIFLIVYSAQLYYLNNSKKIAVKVIHGISLTDILMAKMIINSVIIPISAVTYFMFSELNISFLVTAVILTILEEYLFYFIIRIQLKSYIISSVKGE